MELIYIHNHKVLLILEIDHCFYHTNNPKKLFKKYGVVDPSDVISITIKPELEYHNNELKYLFSKNKNFLNHKEIKLEMEQIKYRIENMYDVSVSVSKLIDNMRFPKAKKRNDPFEYIGYFHILIFDPMYGLRKPWG